MIKSYLLLFIRYMSRHKGFTLINLFGLTIGFICSLTLTLYVLDELSYDTFHPDANRIYRIGFEGSLQGKKVKSAYIGAPIGAALQQAALEVESVLRMASWKTFPLRYQDRSFTEPHLLLVDSNFFSFFSFELIEGNPQHVLKGERALVITESTARKYFDYKGKGDTSPIGKEMVLAQGYTAKVKGIAADPPTNSHFQFTVLLSLTSWDDVNIPSWTTSRVITYVKLKPEASPLVLSKHLRHFVSTHLDAELKQLSRTSIDKLQREGDRLGFFIQQLSNIHLYSDLPDELDKNSNIFYIYVFVAIAVFILMMACINFMNLTTARSASRAKEVGIRKTIGAPTSRLVFQFLMESYLFIWIALVIALFMVLIGLGPFNYITQKSLTLTTLLSPKFLSVALALLASLGLLAGSYPSFYLTRFSPIEIIKGRIRVRFRGYGIRNVLVVFQFFISASLLIATGTVYTQLQHMQKLNLGFNKEHVINLIHTKNLGNKGDVFKAELKKIKGVVDASYCNRMPPHIDQKYVFSTTNPKHDFLLAVYEMDYDHLNTMGYEMVAGRFFSPDFPDDSTAVIINEAAAKALGFTRMERQQLVTQYGNSNGMDREVIGVIKNFNTTSLRDSIQPIAIVLGYQPNWEMAIRLQTEEHEQALETIKKLWKQYAPEAPFEFTYVAENFNKSYTPEKQIGFLFFGFTGIAITIACLGLLGLATFIGEQRTKEIGIRKALGATERGIVMLLNKDFLILVVIANALAWPIAGWFMYEWLHQFAYPAPFPWWVFLISATITISIALFTISYQAWRSASGNPVNSLRNE